LGADQRPGCCGLQAVDRDGLCYAWRDVLVEDGAAGEAKNKGCRSDQNAFHGVIPCLLAFDVLMKPRRTVRRPLAARMYGAHEGGTAAGLRPATTPKTETMQPIIVVPWEPPVWMVAVLLIY